VKSNHSYITRIQSTIIQCKQTTSFNDEVIVGKRCPYIYVLIAVGLKDNFSRFSPEPNPEMKSAEVC
jgi:hypothetical protein